MIDIIFITVIAVVIIIFSVSMVYSIKNTYEIIKRTNTTHDRVSEFFDEYSDYKHEIQELDVKIRYMTYLTSLMARATEQEFEDFSLEIEDIKDFIFKTYGGHIPTLKKIRRKSVLGDILD